MTRRQYAQARRILYQILACRDRLTSDDRDCVELAYFTIARCYEGEAEEAAALRTAATTVGLKP